MRLQKFLFFLLLTICISQLFAGHVTSDRATTVAKNAYVERINLEGNQINAGEIQILSTTADYNGSNVNYYIANVANGGFILIAGDDAVTPILGYSFENNFDDQNLPPQLMDLLGEYKKEMEDVFNITSITVPADVRDEWQKYESGTINVEPIAAVAPLLTCSWSQGCSYNNYCPADGAGPCSKALVGCVAVAMGQVMYYHKYPAKGSGSRSYTHSKYGTLSANFGTTTYQWSSMTNSGSPAAALMLYHCGVSVDMNYGPSASGIPVSALDKVDNAFRSYFNYSKDADILHKRNYSAAVWDNMVRAEIDARRPLFYVGIGTGGHAFNVDGYQGNNHFHLNWGWGGSYNGYFYLSSLSPGGYDFSSSQSAAFNVEPENDCQQNLTITNSMSGGTHDFRASNTIRSSSKISGGANVNMGATTQVKLINGFKVSAGCAFRANLTGCSSLKTTGDMFEESIAQANELETANEQIVVYPNPSFGEFTIELADDISMKAISVYSSQGGLIKQFETTRNSVEIDLNDYSEGFYFLKVIQNGELHTHKLILK